MDDRASMILYSKAKEQRKASIFFYLGLREFTSKLQNKEEMRHTSSLNEEIAAA
jgi:hypothetical protein